MKQNARILLLFVLCAGVILSADAQKNKTKNSKSGTEEEIPLPPPHLEELKEVRIDTLSEEQKKKISDAPDMNESLIPQVDFDTTAVPDDLLTTRIREFMELTKQMELSAGMIRKIYENKDMKALMPDEFRENFIRAYEPGGEAFKYVELMNIRSYRKYYTLNDINEFIKFYQTPAGKKMTQINPLMMGENTTEATKIGKWIGSKIYLQSK